MTIIKMTTTTTMTTRVTTMITTAKHKLPQFSTKMAEFFFGSSQEGSRVMSMIKVTTTTITTRVTTMITTTTKTLASTVLNLYG